MSIIQNVDLVTHQIRTDYLNSVRDGVGERLIIINDAFLNTPGFRAAGWRTKSSNIQRTHSPPIPTAITSEYFQLQAAGIPLVQDEEVEVGGMVTGGGAGDTIGPGLATKRRRRREQIEEEDSSDLSDDSDEEEQRAAQAIKFSKMPTRVRSDSSPLRNSSMRDQTFLNSPSRKRGENPRRGSQSAVEVVKERARGDTVTSSEISSENDLEGSTLQKKRSPRKVMNPSDRIAEESAETDVKTYLRPRASVFEKEDDEDDDEDEESDDLDDSDGSDLSGLMARSMESISVLKDLDKSLTPAPLAIVGKTPQQISKISPKKSKTMPASLAALPPTRPISKLVPRSLLGEAIKLQRSKDAAPFERFATLSGHGDADPIRLRIWVLFAQSKTNFDVLVSRTMHGGEQAGSRQPNVTDLIGLSLWKYGEENIRPQLLESQLNVNRWTLRLMDEGEVDFDFPALDRTKPISQFATMNSKGVRSRSGSKPYDEFALVEATEGQFKENQELPPQFKQETMKRIEVLPQAQPQPPAQDPSQSFTMSEMSNPIMHGMPPWRRGTPMDVPILSKPVEMVAPTKKLLRVNILSLDTHSGQSIVIEVTTGMYFADVLDIVCKKRQLDKANHVLKLGGTNIVMFLDRVIDTMGARTDLDLDRRRFATDGPLFESCFGSTSSSLAFLHDSVPQRSKAKRLHTFGTHPLSKESAHDDSVEVPKKFHKKFTVWRKQPMRFVALNERIIGFGNDHLQILHSGTGKNMFDKDAGKVTIVHFKNVVGCKVLRRHPNTFKLVVFRGAESKRYEFEAKNVEDAAEIVAEIQNGSVPYQVV